MHASLPLEFPIIPERMEVTRCVELLDRYSQEIVPCEW